MQQDRSPAARVARRQRNRTSEQLSDEQLVLFASLRQKRQTERDAEGPAEEEDEDDNQPGQPGREHNFNHEARWRQALPPHLKSECNQYETMDRLYYLIYSRLRNI